MSDLNLVLAIAGGMVLLTGLVSRQLRRMDVPEPLLALAVGVLIGPSALALLDIANWGDQTVILEEAARITLGIGLMGVALRIPKEYLSRNWRSVLLVLLILMPFMWLSGSLLIMAVLGLPLLSALLLAAVITPTDPIVASAIVTGSIARQHLPDRLRHLLSAESGANDGLAYPIVLLSILWLTQPAGAGYSWWLLHALLWGVGGGVLLGGGIGYAAGHLLKWAEAGHAIERRLFLAFAVALTLFALGTVRLLGSEDLLAVFAAGLALDYVLSAGERTEEENIVEAINSFFTLPIFTLIGLVLPWGAWLRIGWAGVLLAVAVLLLRRLPILALVRTRIGGLHSGADVLFLEWFGPTGVAALYYASYSLPITGLEEVWIVGSLILSISIVLHGLSSTPFALWYGRRAQASG